MVRPCLSSRYASEGHTSRNSGWYGCRRGRPRKSRKDNIKKGESEDHQISHDCRGPEMTSQSTSGGQQIALPCSFWVMFGSRFLYNDSTDSKTFTVFETVIQELHFIHCKLLEIFLLDPEKLGAQVDQQSSTWYVNG